MTTMGRDTGERKMMFGMQARHIITTMEMNSSADSCNGASQMKMEYDGWYVDFSADFRGHLLSHMKQSIALSRDPARSAEFKVLKQAHAPSVLIELGYMSNAEDSRLLASPDWQRQVANSIALAVDDFFLKRGQRSP